jgi:hypothetical protein
MNSKFIMFRMSLGGSAPLEIASPRGVVQFCYFCDSPTDMVNPGAVAIVRFPHIVSRSSLYAPCGIACNTPFFLRLAWVFVNY